ncbi:MAG TPA: retropepsin-like aspartic protease [Chitinophagaceae bacterium]
MLPLILVRLTKFLFVPTIGSVLAITTHAQNNGTDKYLAYQQSLDLLNQKEYFRLKDELNLLKSSLDNYQRLFFQAYVDNAFNNNRRSIEEVDTLLKYDFSKLTDSVRARLYLLQDDSYFKLFQYSKAAHCDSVLLNKYSTVLDSAQVEDMKNKLIMRNGLAGISAQQTIIRSNTILKWKKDELGLIEVPIHRNSNTYDAIFDTRANISCISQTYAAKLNLNVLPVSYNEGSGITGIQFKAGIGVADSVYLGGILVRNAVFLVLPDSTLQVTPDFAINIIIGFPVIEQLHEIHIYKDGRMIIPLKTLSSPLHNLALDGLDPIVSVKSETDTLVFHFDLGANQTVLYYDYFVKYNSSILKNGIKKSTEYGGAGGVQKKDVFTIPSLVLFLNDKKITLDSIDVLTQRIYPKEKFYGNLGQDFIRDFNELILNFKEMYIRAR